MNRPDDQDELIRRYREAIAQDTRRPAAHVREAVRAHAEMLSTSKPSTPIAAHTPAANQSRWKLSLLASVALASLTGLLVLQFDRGTPDEQETALGRPAPPVAVSPPATEALPAPAIAEAAGIRREAAPAPAPATPPASPAPRAAAKPAAPAAKPDVKAAPVSPNAGLASPETTVAPPSPPPAEDAPTSARARLADAARSEAQEKASPRSAPPAAARSAAPALRMPAPMQQQQESLTAQTPRSASAPPTTSFTAALHAAARAGRLPELERLLQQGATLNAPDEAGRTALVLAVIHGHTAMVQRLLALGANPALVDRDGLDALQHARRLGREDMARMIEASR